MNNGLAGKAFLFKYLLFILLGWFYGINIAYAQDEMILSCDSGVARRVEDGKYIDDNLIGASQQLWDRAKWLNKDGLIRLSVASDRIVSDGATETEVIVKLYGSDGLPEKRATRFWIETLGGSLYARSSQTKRELHSKVFDVAVEGGSACFKLISPEVPGVGSLRVASGVLGVQGDITFYTPAEKKPIIAVGIVEGAVSLTTIKKNIASPDLVRTGFEDVISGWTKESQTVLTDGTERHSVVAARSAFFLKGVVKGEYLLTAAGDSDRIGQQKLFQDVDPNQFYPVYGDSSVKTFEAQTTGPLYVKVSKDKSYLMYGDFTTGGGGNHLFSVNRSLTGIKEQYVNGNNQATVWVSRTEQRNFVEEQPAAGTSGPYAVGHPNALVNSEVVQLITRDLKLPSHIISITTMQRNVDYGFEPFTGKLVFTNPVPSFDKDGNPIFIRISYEVDQGSGVRNYVYGGDVKFDIGGGASLTLGGSKDQNPFAPYQVYGTALDWNIGSGFSLGTEYAKTSSKLYNQDLVMPIDGSDPTDTVSSEGSAKKLELRYQGKTFQIKAYGATADSEFNNNAAGVTSGQKVVGAAASKKIDEGVSLSADTQKTTNLSTDGERTVNNVSMGLTLTPRVSWDVGVSQVKEDNAVGTTTPTVGSATGIGYGFNQTSLLASAPSATTQATGGESSYVSLKTRVGWKVTDTTNLFSEYERSVQDNRQRWAIGGDYRITEVTKVYSRYEGNNSLTGADGLISSEGKRSTFSAGLETEYMKDGQLFSEYRVGQSDTGTDNGAASGVRNLWHVSKGLDLSSSLEYQHSKANDGSTSSAKVATFGAEYIPDKSTKIGGKLEYRKGDTSTQWLNTFGYDHLLSNSWTAVVRNVLLSKKDSVSGDQVQEQFQLGFAYRDTVTNRFHGLGRYERRYQKTTGTTSDLTSKADIVSFQGNYRGLRRYSLSTQTAYKKVTDDFDSGASDWSAWLLSSRLLVDFAQHMDFGLFGSINRGNGATVRGLGVELGTRVVKDLWFSVGFNNGEYSDVEMFSANTSWTGYHMRLRWKFDEDSFSRSENLTKDHAPYSSAEARQGTEYRLRERQVKEFEMQKSEREAIMAQARKEEEAKQKEENERLAALEAERRKEENERALRELSQIEQEKAFQENLKKTEMKRKAEEERIALLVKQQQDEKQKQDKELARIQKEQETKAMISKQEQEKIDKLQVKVVEEEKKLAEVTQQKDKQTQLVAMLKQEEVEKRKQSETLKKQADDLMMQVKQAEKQRISEQQRLAQLKEENDKQAVEIARSQKDAEDKRKLEAQQIALLVSEKTKIQKETEEEKQRREITAQQEQEKLQKIQEKKAIEEKLLADLLAERQKRIAETQQLKVEAEEKRKQALLLSKQADDLSKQVQQAEQQRQTEQQRLAQLSEEQKKREQETARLQKEADDKRKQMDLLAQQAQDIEKQRQTEQQRLTQLSEEQKKQLDESVRLQKEMDERRRQADMLAKQAQEAEQQRKAEQQRLAQLSAEQKKREQETARLQKEAEDKRKQTELLAKQAQEAEQQRKAEQQRLAQLAEQKRLEDQKRKAEKANSVYRQADISMDELFTKDASGINEILPRGKAKLEVLVTLLKQLSELNSLVIKIHSDGVGDRSSQHELGFARASTIREFLASKGFSKVEILNMADTRPVYADCESKPVADQDACYQANRRVEILFKGKIVAPQTKTGDNVTRIGE